MRSVIIFSAIMLMMIGVAGAQIVEGVPHLINYQGRLTDNGGEPVTDGEYEVTFTIWVDSVSSTPTDREWISPYCTVLVVNGLFNWQLGSRENLPPWTVTNDDNLWLGIQVDIDPEITPRTRLCSVPYAYKAWDSEHAEYADSAGRTVSGCGEAGAFDGVVNYDYVEDGGVTVINFESAFATIEPPQMYVMVVLKGAADGLVEGATIKAVVDIKGVPNNWTGFEITVSKYSGGYITDLTPVFVTWLAIEKR